MHACQSSFKYFKVFDRVDYFTDILIIASLKECSYRSFSLKEESMTISLISADILFNHQRHKPLVITMPNAKSTQMPLLRQLATSQLETLFTLYRQRVQSAAVSDKFPTSLHLVLIETQKDRSIFKKSRSAHFS